MFPIAETSAIPHLKLREEKVTEAFAPEAAGLITSGWTPRRRRSSRSQLFL